MAKTQQPQNKGRVSAAVHAINALVDQQQFSDTKNDDRHRESIRANQKTFWTNVCSSFLTAAIAGAGIYAAVESGRAVSEARNAVVVAQRQAAISEDAERRQVRAYAFPTPISVEDFVVGKAPAGGVNAKTMGQTPAYKIRGQVSVGGLAYPLRDNEDLDRPPKSSQVQNSAFISPSNKFTIKASTADILNQGTFDAINDGKTFRLFVWGRVDYEDAFASPHWFTFCYAYDGVSIRDRGEVEPCPRHNDDDHH